MNENPIDDFFQFERDNDLFSFVDKHRTNVWDLIRYDIYVNLLSSQSESCPQRSKINLTRFFRLSSAIFKWFLSIFRHFDYLFILSSRNYQNGIPVDINAIDTINYIKGRDTKIITVETFADIKDLRYDFDVILPRFPKSIIKFFLRNKYNYDFSELHKIIKLKYPECSLSIRNYENIYLNHYTEKIFYKFFINKWGCKKVLFVQNGVYKGLLAACKELGVDAIEYQHGAIVKAHPIYSYPHLDNPYIGLSLPTYLCVYSNQWLSGVYLPYTKVVEIGNDNLYTQPSTTIDDHNILVISAHGSLGKLILNFIIDSVVTGKLNDYNIYFKLHPYQTYDYDSYLSKTKNYTNIRIIKDGNSMDYIKCSKHIIAVSSTCVYEALQHDVKVHILKLPTYTQMDNIFHLNNVYILDNPHDLVENIIADNNCSIKISDAFYKPFSRDVLNDLIEL